jgi:hypothetical protein
MNTPQQNTASVQLTMESRVRYADGEPAKIVAISTALHDGHPVVAVGTLGVVTRHTLTGSYSERQETTRPWDLVLDEGVADIKLQKQVGHLQDLLRSERKYWAVKKEELIRIIADAAHVSNDMRSKLADAAHVSNDMRSKLADEAHKVDEYRGKFAGAVNELTNLRNQREAYEKLVNELRFDIAKAEVRRVKLQEELMEVRSENTLLEEKLNSFAPNPDENHPVISTFFGYVFEAAKEVSEQNDRTEH